MQLGVTAQRCWAFFTHDVLRSLQNTAFVGRPKRQSAAGLLCQPLHAACKFFASKDGCRRNGRIGPLGIPLLALLVFLEACTIGMLVLRGHVTDGPWFGGLPLAAAIQLYGLFLTPLLLVALAYALTFDKFEMTEDDLERLAEHQRRHEDGS